MKRHIRSRIAEIKEHIKPVLDELGLKGRLETYDDATALEFVSKRADTESPVSVVFTDEALARTGDDIWVAAQLKITDYGYRTVGDSGWDLWTLGDDFLEELPNQLPELAGRVSDALRQTPLVPSFVDTPMCLLNERVADAYEAMNPLVEVRISRTFERGIIPIEHLSFIGWRDRIIVIDFQNGASHAEVYVDCCFKESVEQGNVERFEQLAQELLEPRVRPRL